MRKTLKCSLRSAAQTEIIDGVAPTGMHKCMLTNFNMFRESMRIKLAQKMRHTA